MPVEVVLPLLLAVTMFCIYHCGRFRGRIEGRAEIMHKLREIDEEEQAMVGDTTDGPGVVWGQYQATTSPKMTVYQVGAYMENGDGR